MSYLSSPHQCVVCCAPVSPHDIQDRNSSEFVTCRSFDCKNVLAHRSTMSSAVFKQHLEHNQQKIRHQKKKEAQFKARIDEVIFSEQNENDEIFKRFKKNRLDNQSNTINLVTIPSGMSVLTELPEERKQNYLEHLETIINTAANYDDISDLPRDQHYIANNQLKEVDHSFTQSTVLKSTCDQLCAMCKGGCCVKGAEHAYLSAITIKRFMNRHPEMDSTQILQAYMTRTNSKTIDNSCINHTASGCSLPRELRSDICNAYYCESLTTLIEEAKEQQTHVDVLAVQRSHHYLNRFDVEHTNAIIDIAVINTKTIESLKNNPEYKTLIDTHKTDQS